MWIIEKQQDLQYAQHCTVGLIVISGPCQTLSVVVSMLDALIFVADVVARKRFVVSLAFDIVKRMRYDTAIVASTCYSLSS